jgi:hypothetical protein
MDQLLTIRIDARKMKKNDKGDGRNKKKKRG